MIYNTFSYLINPLCSQTLSHPFPLTYLSISNWGSEKGPTQPVTV